MRGDFDYLVFFGGFAFGLALLVLARWRMQVIYVRNGGVLSDEPELVPKRSLRRVVASGLASVVLFVLFWASTFELAHLGITVVVIWLGWWAWRMAGVFNVLSATVPDRLAVGVLIAVGVLSVAYSMHVFLRGWYGAV